MDDGDRGDGSRQGSASGGSDTARAAGDERLASVQSKGSMHPVNFSSGPLAILQQEVIACRQCPRLVEYIGEIGRVKRRAYREWDYWAKPVPSFGDPAARVLSIGLAPRARGSNRPRRPLTR